MKQVREASNVPPTKISSTKDGRLSSVQRKKHIITATVVDKKGNVISRATNSYSKTHPKQAKYAEAQGEPYKVFLHAEILALIRAKGKGFKLIVERYNSLGEPLLAKPCPICELAIKEAGIQRVEYTI